MSKQKLLITGASGYLGSHVFNSLDLSSYDSVLVIDRTFKADRIKQDKSLFEVEETDLNKAQNLNLSSFNEVIHCAYLNKNEAELKFLAELNKDAYISFFSSAAVYGESNGQALDIDSKLQPVNQYGKNKIKLENFISKNFNQNSILRIANPYGKEYSVKGFYAIAKTKLENGESLNINSDAPNQIIRDFIYIDDLVKQVKNIIEESKEGIFNISTGLGLSLESFLEKELASIFKADLIHYSGFKKEEIQESVLAPSITNRNERIGA